MARKRIRKEILAVRVYAGELRHIKRCAESRGVDVATFVRDKLSQCVPIVLIGEMTATQRHDLAPANQEQG